VDNDFSVRPATFDDMPALRVMHRTSLLALGVGHYTLRQIEGFLHDVDTVDEALLSEGIYRVVEAGGAIAASGGWTRREPSYAGHSPGETGGRMPAGTAWIKAVFTHPSFARRGLAKRLVEICEKDVATLHRDTPLALFATLSARSMYTALGYLPAAPVILPLSNGESFDAILMTKAIDTDTQASA
jgi:GNAT superfamily N-acetyltransferase